MHRGCDIEIAPTEPTAFISHPYDSIDSMTVVKKKPTRLQFRRSGAVALAAILVTVIVMPFAGAVFLELEGLSKVVLAPVALAALIVPLLIAAWSLRSGVDVTADGITVRALVGRRVIPWTQVDGFDASDRVVHLVTTHGTHLALPGVPPSDVQRLIDLGSPHKDDAGDDVTN